MAWTIRRQYGNSVEVILYDDGTVKIKMWHDNGVRYPSIHDVLDAAIDNVMTTAELLRRLSEDDDFDDADDDFDFDEKHYDNDDEEC